MENELGAGRGADPERITHGHGVFGPQELIPGQRRSGVLQPVSGGVETAGRAGINRLLRSLAHILRPELRVGRRDRNGLLPHVVAPLSRPDAFGGNGENKGH